MSTTAAPTGNDAAGGKPAPNSDLNSITALEGPRSSIDIEMGDLSKRSLLASFSRGKSGATASGTPP